MTEDEKDKVVYKREYLEPLIEEKIRFFNPPNNSVYRINETIETSNNIDNINKYQIIVELDTTTTEQYRYRKYINEVAVEPPEYSNNGVVYDGKSTESKRILNDSEYEITIIKQRGETK